MNEDFDWRLDSYRAWLLALELARDGHEGLREFFGKRAEPEQPPA